MPGLRRPGKVFGQFQYPTVPLHATAEADQVIADALDQLIEGATKPADDGPDGDDDGTAGGARRTG